MVAGGVHFIIGELPPDVHVLEHGLPVQQELDQLVYLGNAENVLFHGLPLVGAPGQVVQAHAEMVRQGAEIIKARFLFASFKPLILARCNAHSLRYFHLRFVGFLSECLYSFVNIHIFTLDNAYLDVVLLVID